MTNEEAKQLYYDGVAQYEQGAFSEALSLLDQLDAARPNSKNVTLQRALCFIGLAQLDEAEACCKKLEGKADPEELSALRRKIREAHQPVEAPVAEAEAPAADSGVNELAIESVFPASIDQTTVTGHMKSGVFHTGDTVTVVSPDGMPMMAPILRIGTEETPLNLVRQGQQAVLLLQIEPQQVVPGSSVTSADQEAAYAATMVVSADPTSSADAELSPEIIEAEKHLKKKQYQEAHDALEQFFAKNAENRVACRLMARVFLESEPPLQDVSRALALVRKSYELGGAEDPAVIDTLAQALAANGEAEQGLRFLERLYGSTADMQARAALATRLHDFRVAYGLGHVWEFADEYGEVVFETSNIAEVVKALQNKTIPLDAKCRRDHIGEWQHIETRMAPEYAEIQAFYGGSGQGAGSKLWLILIGVLVLAIVLVLVLL